MWRCSPRSSPARRAVRTAMRMGYLGPFLCPRRRETALDATVSPGSRYVQRTFCLAVDEFGIFWLKVAGRRYPDRVRPPAGPPSGGQIDQSVSYKTDRYRPCYDRRRATARSDQGSEASHCPYRPRRSSLKAAPIVRYWADNVIQVSTRTAT